MQPDLTEPTRDRAGSGRTPLYLSALALVMAVVAAIVAVVALARTGDPVVAALAAGTGVATPTVQPTGAGTPTPTEGPTAEPTTDPTTEPPAEPTDGPDPSAVFTVAYDKRPLRLQPSSARTIDLDLPSANAQSSTGELEYSGYVPQTKFSFFSGNALAEITSPSPTAGDCVQQLRQAPIDLEVAPSKGQQLCVLTSAAKAVDQGIRQRVVLVRVDAIAADGTLNVTVTAWNVPR